MINILKCKGYDCPLNLFYEKDQVNPKEIVIKTKLVFDNYFLRIHLVLFIE